MKTLLITFITLLSLNSFAATGDAIQVSGKLESGEVINTTVKGLRELRDSLDYEDLSLKFKVVLHKRFINTPERVAKYIHKHLFSDITVKEPVPCGYVLDGEIKFNTLPETSFSIVGGGDGGYDTCTGQGGPGAWDFKIIVKMNKDKQTGEIKISWYEE